MSNDSDTLRTLPEQAFRARAGLVAGVFCLICLVCLDEPHSWTTAGGSLSAPVCAEVLEQTLVYKGIPRASLPAPSTAETSADLPEDGDSFDGA